MLADVNIDLVTAFLPDAKSMAAFARASRRSKEIVYANIPASIESAGRNMTKYQKETLCNLAENPGLGHLKAITERKCLVCHKSYKGGIRAPWGISAHPECTKGLETNVRYVNGGIPTEIMPLVRSTIPVNVRDGYSSHRGQFSFETVIIKAIPGVIPQRMTLAHFRTGHTNEVKAWMERVRQEKSAEQERRKRAASEQRQKRQKKQRGENEHRRASIEGMVGTTYLKWMRTVPSFAKKFVSKLSAEESVTAVAVVNKNADLSDEIHDLILSPGCVRQSATDLEEAYALIRKSGDVAVTLLRRRISIRAVRAAIIAREEEEQIREGRDMVREDKYPLKQPGETGRICRCGRTTAIDCIFNMCGVCCPMIMCPSHTRNYT